MSLITLITDFGTKDYYVALMKASILTRVPTAQFVDINHNIAPHDIMEGAFYLKSVFRSFPENTFHLVHVNSFYTRVDSLIVFSREGHFFAGPNNGLFSLIFDDLTPAEVYEVKDVDASPKTIYALSGFIAAQLYQDNELSNFGLPVEQIDQKISLKPVITGSQIRATIIHVDHFGNVLVNLDRTTFEHIRNGRDYAIFYKTRDPITRISQAYSDVPAGDVCAIFTSIDMLEIAINMGNAHQLLNLNKNETIQINFY